MVRVRQQTKSLPVYFLSCLDKNATVGEQKLSPGGEVVNATVCKTVIRGFDSHPGLTCLALAKRESWEYCACAQYVGSLTTERCISVLKDRNTSELRPAFL